MTQPAISIPVETPAEPLDDIDVARAELAKGEVEEAVALLHARASADPIDHEARYWLASALIAAGLPDHAAGVLAEARDLHAMAVIRELGADMQRFGADRAYCGQLGRQFYGSNLMACAALTLGRSLDFENLDANLLLSYGLSLQHQGRINEAIDVFSAAAETFGSPAAHQFLLYPLFHVPDRGSRLLAESTKWAELYVAPLMPVKPRFANERSTARRLRVGYVGPTFTRNQVAGFMAPVLESHDPSAVEVFLYCANPDSEAALPKSCKVRGIGHLSDEQAAAQIRADKIDVLIDIWGHNAGSRLCVFGHRPAPVQIAWINFLQTTGMSCMDHVLHADCMDVPGTAAAFVEEVWRIGEIMAPYRPSAERLDPTPTPALRNGYVTFGSFNNPTKLSDATLAAWGEILKARPNDRLVLKYGYYTDPVLQRVIRAKLAGHGAQPEQVEFRGHNTGPDYFREFQDIDLALDPSPCPGGTTTCDAMANGLPVLTLDAGDFYARIGVSVVLPCGFPELMAESWDAYVARALSLTANHRALDGLRARVRPAFEASAYRDEAGFARNLEAVFRQMFERWLAKGA